MCKHYEPVSANKVQLSLPKCYVQFNLKVPRNPFFSGFQYKKKNKKNQSYRNALRYRAFLPCRCRYGQMPLNHKKS